PKCGPTAFDDLNRDGSSIAQAKVRPTMTPTPGVVIKSRVRASDRAIASRRYRWSASGPLTDLATRKPVLDVLSKGEVVRLAGRRDFGPKDHAPPRTTRPRLQKDLIGAISSGRAVPSVGTPL